jgi:serine/threonine-protein phosphatase PGAM5
MTQRKIYMIRHGQYVVDAVAPDDLGGGLTDLGRRQAELVAQRFSAMPVDVIFHSGLRRAHETAEIVASRLPGIELRESALLRECIPCIPLGLEGIFTHLSPEQLDQNAQQARAAYDTHFTPSADIDCHDLLICHGNIIRYFMLRALMAPVELWANAMTYNCGVSEVWMNDHGRASLVSHNDCGHLPTDLRTF